MNVLQAGTGPVEAVRSGLLVIAAISAATAAVASAMGRKGWIDGFMADTSAALFIGFAMAAALMAAMAPAS